MKLQVIKNKVLYWLRSIALYSLYLTVLLALSSFFVLQLPAVQTRISKSFLSSLSDQTGFKATVGRIEFYWFDRILIDQLSIVDPEGNRMISAKKLLVNFTFSGIFSDKNIRIDGVAVDSAHVFFTRIQETDSTRNLNINVFTKRLRKGEKGKTQGGGSIRIGEAVLQQSSFTYATDRDSIASGFDYNHFAVALHEAELQRFFLLDDTVEFKVASFQATETKTNFTIHQLQTFFRICDTSMEFLELNLHAGESIIRDTVVLTFTSQHDLGDFVNNVSITGNLSNTIVYPKDLALFFAEARALPYPVQLNGQVKGKISDFRFTGMNIEAGNTHLTGSLEMEGLPDLDETFIVLSLKKSQLNFDDLGFVLDENVVSRLKPLGRVTLSGQFLGYPSDFVANGDFESDIGIIRSDINLKLDETDFDRSTYKGKLTLVDFDLGKYLNDTILFQKVSIDGQINGSGLTANSADFTLNGKISSVGIKNYKYTGIETNARFASQLFAGKLSVNDPNLKVAIDGSIDLRNSVNRFNIKGAVDTLQLEKINLTTKPVFVRTKLDVDMQGLVLDSLRGTATLSDLSVIYKEDSLHMNEITLIAKRDQIERSLNLKTSVADAEITGDFYFSTLFTDIQRLLKEFYLNIENNKEATTSYYSTRSVQSKQYHADFAISLKNISPVMELSDIPLYISHNTQIEGRFSIGSTANIQAFSRFDTLSYGTETFYRNLIELSASKVSDSARTLAVAYIQSAKQKFTNDLESENLALEAIWDSQQITIDFNMAQKTDNAIDLHATIDFLDSTYIRFKPSTIKLLDQRWQFNPLNEIAIKGKEWVFKQTTLVNQHQAIGLNGSLSEDSTRSLTLFVTDLDLQSINPVIARKLSGIVNATVILANYYNQASIQNSLLIKQLSVDGFLIGDITGNNLWNPDQNIFNLSFFIDRLGNRIVNCEGIYNPSDNSSPLSMSAEFTQANLRIFEPFLEDILSQLQGTITGTYKITGQLSDPKLNGSGRVENGGAGLQLPEYGLRV
ncbi:hypothetical protein QQ054_25440 [Oscillatoria amoena NRMC-F 0135]|nr:hypothetical protein [Oscillatoria amoena NRMC-F 0135]